MTVSDTASILSIAIIHGVEARESYLLSKGGDLC